MVQLNPQYLVDDKGRKKAVLLSMEEFRQLLEQLEELEDARELEEAVATEKEVRNYREIREELIREDLL